MRKLSLALVIAVALVLTAAVPAFAAYGSSGGLSPRHDGEGHPLRLLPGQDLLT